MGVSYWQPGESGAGRSIRKVVQRNQMPPYVYGTKGGGGGMIKRDWFFTLFQIRAIPVHLLDTLTRITFCIGYDFFCLLHRGSIPGEPIGLLYVYTDAKQRQ